MMGQEETIRLLQECDAGVQMGIASIQEVLPYVKEEKFRQLLLGWESCFANGCDVDLVGQPAMDIAMVDDIF